MVYFIERNIICIKCSGSGSGPSKVSVAAASYYCIIGSPVFVFKWQHGALMKASLPSAFSRKNGLMIF